jgi:hypothetical protein
MYLEAINVILNLLTWYHPRLCVLSYLLGTVMGYQGFQLSRRGC